MKTLNILGNVEVLETAKANLSLHNITDVTVKYETYNKDMGAEFKVIKINTQDKSGVTFTLTLYVED